MRTWLTATSVTAHMGTATYAQAQDSIAVWYPGGVAQFVADVAQRGTAYRRRILASVGELADMRMWLTGQGCDVTEWPPSRVLTGVGHGFPGGVAGFLADTL